MSKNFFEELGKKIDVFANDSEVYMKDLKEKAEKIAKDSEGDIKALKEKAEVFTKDLETYVEKVSKDVEPIFKDIKDNIEKVSQDIKNEFSETERSKIFKFKINGTKKYKLKYKKSDNILVVTRKDSKREFKIYLNPETITTKKVEKIIKKATVDNDGITVVIKLSLLK